MTRKKKFPVPMETCWDCGGRGFWIRGASYPLFGRYQPERKMKCETCKGACQIPSLLCVCCGARGEETSVRGPWRGMILCHEHMWDPDDPGKPLLMHPVWELILRPA